MTIKFSLNAGHSYMEFEAGSLSEIAGFFDGHEKALQTIASAARILATSNEQRSILDYVKAASEAGNIKSIVGAPLVGVVNNDGTISGMVSGPAPTLAEPNSDNATVEASVIGTDDKAVAPDSEEGQQVQRTAQEWREHEIEAAMTDAGDGSPQKRKRRTKAEMEAAREAEKAVNASAPEPIEVGEVPVSGGNGTIPPHGDQTSDNTAPEIVAAPQASLPVAPVPSVALPPPVVPPVASAPLPLPPAPPVVPALPPAPRAPAILAGRVIEDLNRRAGASEEEKGKLAVWLAAYQVVTKGTTYDDAINTIRLMQDDKLARVASALNLDDE